ncbi:MAG TPA: triose-phosphate isomerase [Gemmatimonadales bacterium]|nr:triose-phosphate isomerase [Gemmatimonadales bacterium]
MRELVLAANWKMQVTPAEARDYAADFLTRVRPRLGRDLWFFPPAVSLESTVRSFLDRADVRVGAQDVYWEAKGAFTGALSVPLVAATGAAGALVGHSERRHIFGETDADTARKVQALLAGGLVPLLCVGEQLADRDAGRTESVVLRQLGAALAGLAPVQLARVLLAYEPVWAIGTGKVATPADAAQVHRVLRATMTSLGAPGRCRILYGGSVSPANAGGLVAEPEVDGLLVGGASLTPEGWGAVVAATDAV